jgi:hypothetical protein
MNVEKDRFSVRIVLHVYVEITVIVRERLGKATVAVLSGPDKRSGESR